MTSFHSATFALLSSEPQTSLEAQAAIGDAERRLGIQLPVAVREWYHNSNGIEILAKYSNQDHPIPPEEFAAIHWNSLSLLPFKYENQGVCKWAISLDGCDCDDPPVYVDVDSDGDQWTIVADAFSTYVYSCVWDYSAVIDQPALVQAQNRPLSDEAVSELRVNFCEQPPTLGWPGSKQLRFAGDQVAILIWASEGQADWFVGGCDAVSVEEALRVIWNIDGVGPEIYECTEAGEAAIRVLRTKV